VTVWVGEIQWMLKNGYDFRRNPILAPLDHIEHRDALLDADGSEAAWPTADVIVGNPPFLGDKMMRGELGDSYVERLRKRYEGRVPGGADLVTYWFEKEPRADRRRLCERAGLVATNSIRGGANRKVLDRIVDTTRIFEAWSDEAWVNEGAAVRVSLLGFGRGSGIDGSARLDNAEVAAIHADLTAGAGLDLTQAKPLQENARAAFQGITKGGAFDVPGAQARQWLTLPNPNGRPNADVVRPWRNGMDVTQRPGDKWIVDFAESTESVAALFEAPFGHVLREVRPERALVARERRRRIWWQFNETAPGMRMAIVGLARFIATPEVAKHRVFVWLPASVVADKNLVVVARPDDATFAVLQSRFHALWALRMGTSLEDRPRYTSRTTFETFPFPEHLTPRDTAQTAPTGPLAENIAAAARRLNELRENWLNPTEWVDWVITPEEEKAGFPKRPVARPGHEADLKKRTLTNLYNARPAWLALAHQELDSTVAAAYGWSDYTPAMPDEEILRRLLALNLQRSAAG
jgi:type II restriction/modification system DNA methylase subunit YeeA